jgi:hypothetical protein
MICHLEVYFKNKYPSQQAVNGKAYKSGANPENCCVAKIFKKFSFAHSITGLEDYGRKKKIEESFMMKCEVLCFLFT